MITRTTIRNAVIAWLTTALPSLTHIAANQPGPRPTDAYTTTLVQPPRPIGHEHRLTITDPGAPAAGEQLMAGSRMVSVSIQVFRDDAHDNARTAAQALALESVRATLRAAGLAPAMPIPTVTDLTEGLPTEFEERALLEPEFFCTDEYTDDVYLIDRVSGTGSLEYPEGESRGTIDYDTGA